MSRKSLSHYALAGAVFAAVAFSVFEISPDPQFALPAEVLRADPAWERQFADCFAQHDRVVHERAFSQIDNPDVQREFITSEREKARQICRERHPERLETVRTPLRIRLFTLRFRYGD